MNFGSIGSQPIGGRNELRISSKLIQKNPGAVLVNPEQFLVDTDKGKMGKKSAQKYYYDHKPRRFPIIIGIRIRELSSMAYDLIGSNLNGSTGIILVPAQETI
ncbi:hypothetical protein ACEW7V_00245 [Areca yellow leaf disease phytoplasma]|uniref:hypothetical protein n=1 Tax=Areca yellow leaf disease phytoplasma TaxID=927614 RepID=UPI0035B54C0F